MTTQVKPEQIWRLGLPDWEGIDTVWQRSLPFVLWPVGEQCLLFHWLDAAVDAGVDKVVLYTADRPATVRKVMQETQLWPLDWEIVAVQSLDQAPIDHLLDRLPAQSPLAVTPSDGWSLVQHWHSLEQEWLRCFAECNQQSSINLAIGRHCEIHQTAKLVAPYWIGDNVSIGPNAVIGPGTVIRSGCILEGDNLVVGSHLSECTYLGPSTELVESVLEGPRLLNLRRRACVDGLDQFIAGATGKVTTEVELKPDWQERLIALRLWWRWRYARRLRQLNSVSRIQGVDGNAWTVAAGPLWESRRHLLAQVWQGKMRLFGAVPRSQEHLNQLPAEWAGILKRAPVGALSYADALGAELYSEEEALHTVFMLTDPTGRTRALCDNWIHSLLEGEMPKLAQTC